MRVFIVGSPFTGKSTLLARLTGGKEIGTLAVKDERLDALVRVFRPRKITPLKMTLVDSDALGKLYNENKPTRIFQELVEAHVFLEVSGGLVGDFMSFTDTTLKFLTIESNVLSKRLERLRKEVAVGRADARELEVIERALAHVSEGIPLYAAGFSEDEVRILKGLGLLSIKPRVVLFNATDDGGPDEDALEEVRAQGLPHITINVLRAPEEVLNAEVSRALLSATDTITFFTPSERETRAWPLARGSTALAAAATIHNDLARGFVRVEVIPWDRLVEAGGWKEARERNWVRVEGRDYVVKDGDCLYVRAST
ncbi:MAG: DUF933 domain-containing protein [Thermotogae bacterium]|nr:DUF933 domain-containing protein [Thermotogota bacterium]